MPLTGPSFRETRVWRAGDDGHFYIFECFERLAEGGFLCPYASVHRNWNFMSQHIDDVQLRHKVFAELSKPQARIYNTIEEAIDNFDLSQAVDG